MSNVDKLPLEQRKLSNLSKPYRLRYEILGQEEMERLVNVYCYKLKSNEELPTSEILNSLNDGYCEE